MLQYLIKKYDNGRFGRSKDLIEYALEEYKNYTASNNVYKPVVLTRRKNDVINLESDNTNDMLGTTSFFAIDKYGNVGMVASSINGYFGSGVIVNGN